MADTADGSAATVLGPLLASTSGVLMARPDRWSRCGCVINTEAITSRKMYAALAWAVTCGRFMPANGPSFKTALPSLSMEISRLRDRMMPARSVPASTATTEPLDHSVEADRTRRPVTASSLGPPVGPYGNG